MVSTREIGFSADVEEAYAKAVSRLGDLGLELRTFSEYLQGIVGRRSHREHNARRLKVQEDLHADALYLVGAILNRRGRAWSHFLSTYGPAVFEMARSTFRNSAPFEDAVYSAAQAFLTYEQARIRLSRYDGRGSLPAWLRASVMRETIRQAVSHSGSQKRIQIAGELAAWDWIAADVDSFFDEDCEVCAIEALEWAGLSMTERERLVLILAYGCDVDPRDLAQTLDVDRTGAIQLAETAFERLKLEFTLARASHCCSGR